MPRDPLGPGNRPSTKAPQQKAPRGHTNVGLIRLEGSIMPGGAIDYFKVNTLLEAAFASPDIDTIALYVNSPGGSPAQSEMIGRRIKELSQKFGKDVTCFVGDVGASGGYWIAAAADEIYLYKTSVVGSIGVVSSKMGAVEKLKKEGLEDRTQHSGKKKVTNSPYKPVDQKEKAAEQKKLEYLHHEFINWVQECRGNKLDSSLIDKNNILNSELFSGETWFGDQAVKIGLADGVGTINSVLEQKFGSNVKINQIALRPAAPGGGGPRGEKEQGGPDAANDDYRPTWTQVSATAEKKRYRVKAGSRTPKFTP